MHLTDHRFVKWLSVAQRHIFATLVSGGVLAAVAAFVLNQLGQPEPSIWSDVSINLTVTETAVSSVSHHLILGNDGDLILENGNIGIKFSPTAGAATGHGPVLVARPDTILDNSVTRWVDEGIRYEVQIPKFAPGSEISLIFDADQPLVVDLEILADEIQTNRVYACDVGSGCRLE